MMESTGKLNHKQQVKQRGANVGPECIIETFLGGDFPQEAEEYKYLNNQDREKQENELEDKLWIIVNQV